MPEVETKYIKMIESTIANESKEMTSDQFFCPSASDRRVGRQRLLRPIIFDIVEMEQAFGFCLHHSIYLPSGSPARRPKFAQVPARKIVIFSLF